MARELVNFLFILEKQKSIGNVKLTRFDFIEFEGEEDSNKKGGGEEGS